MQRLKYLCLTLSETPPKELRTVAKISAQTSIVIHIIEIERTNSNKHTKINPLRPNARPHKSSSVRTPAFNFNHNSNFKLRNS